MNLIILLLSLLIATPSFAGVQFTGDANEKICFGDIDSVEATPLSFYSRFNLDSLAPSSDENALWTKYDSASSSTRSFLFRVEQAGTISFFTHNGSTQRIWQSSETISAGTDYCVVATFDGNSTSPGALIDLWVNGTKFTTGGFDDTNSIASNATEVCIGRWDSVNDRFDGKYYEAAFWAGVELTANEADQLCDSNLRNMPLQIQPGSLQIYAKLDDFTGGSALSTTADEYRDSSGNGNHGTGTDTDGDADNIAENVLSYP